MMDGLRRLLVVEVSRELGLVLMVNKTGGFNCLSPSQLCVPVKFQSVTHAMLHTNQTTVNTKALP